MLTLLSALTLAAAPGPLALNPQQATALRCGVVFALGARLQQDRRAAAADWPDLQTRGKEFFVRVTAKLMDETGASREAVSARAGQEVAALPSDAAVIAAVPGCLPLLGAAGL